MLFSEADSACFADYGDFHLSGICHFVLNATCDFRRQLFCLGIVNLVCAYNHAQFATGLDGVSFEHTGI